MGLENLRRIKQGLDKKEKVYRGMPKKSAKKLAEEAKQKENYLEGLDRPMEAWHKARRKEAIGVCKCGCGNPSQKNSNTLFRHSNCHIFPKRIFESIKLHPKNCIELAYIGGCHNNMDDRGVELWPNMECWDEIKEKILILEPLISPEEKKHKLYSLIMKTVYEN
jgi:hypothetical protein